MMQISTQDHQEIMRTYRIRSAMIGQDFTSSITERTKVSVKSSNSTRVDRISELNLSEAEAGKIV
jgi:hypothetical protein